MSKIETAEKLGSELVQEWRGSLRTRPPPVEVTSPYWPGKDRKYADLTAEQIPRTESLMDCMERTEPLWEERILHELRKGRNVLVVAHANTLRGLVKLIDNIGDDEIQGKRSLTECCCMQEMEPNVVFYSYLGFEKMSPFLLEFPLCTTLERI